MQPLSKKLREKLDKLRYVGIMTAEEAQDKGMRLAVGADEYVRLYWLVDPADGIIADAKFQVFGSVYLIAAAEIASELAMRKNYRQIGRLSADLIDQHVRDKQDVAAFPKEAHACLNQVLSAIDMAVALCSDLPAPLEYDITPIELDFSELLGGIPGWDEFSMDKKIYLIEEVVDKEIRPYIELDAGGVKILELKENGDLLISYEGSCTSCHSSTGSTLSAIQKIVRSRIHPSLTVIPQL